LFGKSTKRQKEQARQQHQREKDEKRAERRKQKAERLPASSGSEDPDLEGIVPGPQPVPPEP
jgi:hypothetical protein